MVSPESHVRWLYAAPVYLGAYMLAALVFWWIARRRGMASDGLARVMAAGLIGGLVGANLVEFLATGLPGKTIEGGIAGGWLAVLWTKHRLGVTRPTGDLFALAIPAGEALGRIGCFIGGCCYGKASTVAWAIHDHGALRHPAQLYSSLGAALCFFALLAVERRRVLPENGLFYLGGIFFCLDRFIVEFFREATTVSVGITLAQIACLAGIAFFSAMLGRLVRNGRVLRLAPATS